MRTRVWLTSVALGAALVTGGTVATAHAASTSSGASTTTSSPVVPFAYTDIGTYRTLAACQAAGESSIYSDWFCRKSTTTSNWHLWVNLNS
ncbi:hypothetical protein [Streptomyces sp. NRRL S-1448]|uniref:hypothetical protein n=1 Tax=Streptomyces sp. NRRL S-1448 TaxID=1463883 RepID=UPI0004BF866F|nr:hypothetical protein [Streptomyces sp. NRRL S-1448]